MMMGEANTSSSWVWTTERTSALINWYKLYPILYNASLPNYKDKATRQQAWENIGKQLGTTAQEIVKKVRGLRTQFSREKVKEFSKANEKTRFISPWVHYNALKFLDEFTTMKAKQSNEWNVEYNSEIEAYNEHHDMNSVNPNAYVAEDDIKTEIDDCVIVEDIRHVSSGVQEQNLSHRATPSKSQQLPFIENDNRHVSRDTRVSKQLQTTVTNKLQQSSPTMVRGIKRPTFDIMKRHVKPRSAHVNELRDENPVSSSQESPGDDNRSHGDDNRSQSDDSDDLFVKYIASELRQIRDKHVKRIVKHNIQNIIFEAHCSLQENT